MSGPERILLVHSRYQERGGEESAYEAQGALLEERGHTVFRYERDNADVAKLSAAGVALRTIWSAEDHRAIGELVRRERIQVVHFHNTFPLISAAAHHAAKRAGAKVVQTLHNFRWLCPGGLLLRNGAACELCVSRAVPWPAVVHGCYRGSAAASAVVTGMVATHRLLGTWHSQVDAFIALSRFARERFVRGGFPAARVHVSAPFVRKRLTAEHAEIARGCLFVGRLTAEKGLLVLLDAWKRLAGPPVELVVVGDGPLRGVVEQAAAADSRITYLGPVSHEQVLTEMARAAVVVFPSLCYENYPGVLAEAQAVGVAVIASDIGSGAEIVREGGFGIIFPAGDAGALAHAVLRLHEDHGARRTLAERGRAAYETSLTPDAAYARLMEIYET